MLTEKQRLKREEGKVSVDQMTSCQTTLPKIGAMRTREAIWSVFERYPHRIGPTRLLMNECIN